VTKAIISLCQNCKLLSTAKAKCYMDCSHRVYIKLWCGSHRKSNNNSYFLLCEIHHILNCAFVSAKFLSQYARARLWRPAYNECQVVVSVKLCGIYRAQSWLSSDTVNAVDRERLWGRDGSSKKRLECRIKLKNRSCIKLEPQ